jgi:hypothetical protein
MTIKTAIDVLTEALRTDPGYREAWKANIAMSFYDEVRRQEMLGLMHVEDYQDIHRAANNGAENFLDLLCFKPDTVKDTKNE